MNASKASPAPRKRRKASTATFESIARHAMRRASKTVLRENARFGLPLAGGKVSETSR